MAQMVPLAKITVHDRQRIEYGELTDLAESFKKFGQLQSILLSDDGTLLAGGRRLAAAAMLGWTEIRAEYKGEPVDELRAQEIELEENLQRKDLTWHEQQRAISKIHDIKTRTNADWSIDKTADLIGKSRRTVYNALELTKALEKYEDVASAETPQGAMQRLARIKDIEKRQSDVKIAELAQLVGFNKAEPILANTFHMDAVEGLQSHADESVDCVITNPPFGVNIADTFKGERKIYEDDPNTIFPMLFDTFKEVYRILKPDRWFLTFWPTGTIELGKWYLYKAGFTFDPVPWIWYKPDKFVTAMGDPYSDANIQYETFFIAKKGKPRWSALPTGNVINCPISGHDRLHPLQMPPAFWQRVIPYISQMGELIVEPFSGSGSAGVAAIRLKNRYIGYDNDLQWYERSQLWLTEERMGVRRDGPADGEIPMEVTTNA